ncbi:hypothetical protein [Candidatus Rariloculus sp.]|uniref:hypothetical protein n=1 Tax=Candidatus Rariloculus sp. TaxID=3101265 RepID=UPI003D133A95
MTVCIAALYGDGQGAVLMSDQMITAHIPIGYEYEHAATTKIIAVDEAQSTYALLAGDVLTGNEIVRLAKAELLHKGGEASAPEIAEFVRQAYQAVRLNFIVQTEMEARGLSLESFYDKHQSLAPQVVQMVDQAMTQADIRVQLLVVGASGNTHTLHTIINPGVITENTAIGHGALGSGAPHALAELIKDGYNASLARDDVLEMVQRAKTRSEVAPGVGPGTTTLVIPEDAA